MLSEKCTIRATGVEQMVVAKKAWKYITFLEEEDFEYFVQLNKHKFFILTCFIARHTVNLLEHRFERRWRDIYLERTGPTGEIRKLRVIRVMTHAHDSYRISACQIDVVSIFYLNAVASQSGPYQN